MNKKHLAIYLNDHLAGSSGAIHLMQTLETAFAHSSIASVVAEIHAEILTERADLQRYMQTHQISESTTRKAGAWLGAKALDLKLMMEDYGKGPLFLHEGLEALSVGIAGKHLLWMALGKLVSRAPEFEGLDFNGLAAQAISQRERVETVRLESAEAAFLA